MGAGVEEVSLALKTRYPNATVTSLNEAFDLATFLALGTKSPYLPCADQSVDMIFANFSLPWQDNFISLLQEWRRILHPQGLLLFTALGPDTLKECRAFIKHEDIPQFMDMHDLGDLLLKAGFNDPVVEVDHYILSYQDCQKLPIELLLTGMWFPQEEEALSHFLKNTLSQVTYEVIFAHAFAASLDDTHLKEQGPAKIPLSSLRAALTKKT